jgi:spore coat protein U-like protein
MTRVALAGLASALLSLPLSLSLQATEQTSQTPVTGQVVAMCAMRIKDPSLFSGTPAEVMGQGQTGVSANINVVCTKGTLYTVSLDQGMHAAPASTCQTPLRRMVSASGQTLAYELRKGSPPNPRTALYGCDAGNDLDHTSDTGLAETGVGPTVVLTPGQDLEAGSYADTVTVTLSW